jgi:hypothetical protein
MAAVPDLSPEAFVRCGCGRMLVARDEAELLDVAEDHVRSVHPELVGTLSPLELARPRGGRGRLRRAV